MREKCVVEIHIANRMYVQRLFAILFLFSQNQESALLPPLSKVQGQRARRRDEQRQLHYCRDSMTTSTSRSVTLKLEPVPLSSPLPGVDAPKDDSSNIIESCLTIQN